MPSPPTSFAVALVENDYSVHSSIKLELEKQGLSDPSVAPIHLRQMPVLASGDAPQCDPAEIVRAVLADQPRLVVLDLSLAAGESGGVLPDGRLPSGCRIFADL